MPFNNNLKTQVKINGRFLTQKITGVQRYAIELTKALDNLLCQEPEIDNAFTFEILMPKACVNILQLRKIKIKKIPIFKGVAWEQIILPLYSQNEILINLCNTGPIFKKNQIVVIHDAAIFVIPQNFSSKFRIYYKIVFKFIKYFTKKIITISNFSKNEISKYLSINAKNISVIYEGHEHIFKTLPDLSILKKNSLTTGKFVLAISSLNPNKNFKSVIESMKFISDQTIKFVFAGGENNKIFKSELLNTSENVKHLGYITDSELRALYENALCFVFPSYYEGFGLPPIEAIACGCPTIVSKINALSEVGGSNYLYCDPNKPMSIANQILEIYSNRHLRMKLVNNGIARSKDFTWKKTAKEFIEQINLLNSTQN